MATPRPDPMPELIRPMLATLGELPPPGEDDEYGYEMEWDGLRAVIYVAGGRVRVVTRNDRDVSVAYPELQDLAGHSATSRQSSTGRSSRATRRGGSRSWRCSRASMCVTRPRSSGGGSGHR